MFICVKIRAGDVMKKISVYDLVVISITKDGSCHQLICKKGVIRKGYFEVLTGDKVEAQSSSDIVPLSKFYSPLGTHNPDGSPLMLDSKDILKKYIEINNNNSYDEACHDNSIDACDLVDVDSILDQATAKVFPKSGSWGSDCFDRPTILGVCYLPCNMRDDVWMAKLLRQNSNLYFISLGRIIKYVKNSEYFRKCRDNYEQEVVRWQINWMTSGGDNWIVSDEFGGDFLSFDEDYDIGFRKGIVDTLEAIGMNHDAIEKGIERNADMWRDSIMNATFMNRFEPTFLYADFSLGGCTESSELFPNQNKAPRALPERPSDEFREKWIKLRKYEYYQAHKDVVDAHGQMDDAYTLTDDELVELKVEVFKMSEERKAYLKEFEAKNSPPKQYVKNSQ